MGCFDVGLYLVVWMLAYIVWIWKPWIFHIPPPLMLTPSLFLCRLNRTCSHRLWSRSISGGCVVCKCKSLCVRSIAGRPDGILALFLADKIERWNFLEWAHWAAGSPLEAVQGLHTLFFPQAEKGVERGWKNVKEARWTLPARSEGGNTETLSD